MHVKLSRIIFPKKVITFSFVFLLHPHIGIKLAGLKLVGKSQLNCIFANEVKIAFSYAHVAQIYDKSNVGQEWPRAQFVESHNIEIHKMLMTHYYI